ncbi:MAG TPA: GAF domain-containing protein, partial [Acidimicrobiales bacterium]
MPQRRERGRSRRRDQMTLVDAMASLTDPALARLAPAELFDELLDRSVTALAADSAAFVLRDGDSFVVRAEAGVGAVPVDAELLHRVTSHGEPVIAGDATGGGSFAGCPVLVDGEMRGLVFARAARKHHFSADDVRLLRRVADRLAGGVERASYDEAERAAQDALAESEHRVRTLVEAAPLGIVEFDAQARIERWNRAAATLLDWPRWLVGVAPRAQLPKDALGAVNAAIGGNKTDGVRVTIERPGTRAVELSLSAAPVTDRNGDVDGALLLLDDVTERELLEQHIRQAQRLEAMARLAGGVAH